MFGNLRIDDAFPNLAQERKGSAFVALHVPAEADHVRDEDRGEPAGDGAWIQGRLCVI